ncbi:hypothetical protein GKQ77_31480 [Streptomyces sp. BG9H]|uniref:Uncharacterized protein n=1 Tax=Streptomyces anatolicus TaxID=2675858 RepID=A0ABS6YXA0_9ACTN|nr:hypothetical protein [Streptomyces anatolicus]MBW5426029.1 hypothetical protein [Streptomyces anatolicus]
MKPCYLITDADGGYVSRLADNIEAIQLGMATQLLEHADVLLADLKAGTHELRYLAKCLSEALRDVHRIAEGRGARMPLGDGEGWGC